jgi:hypothetical protein
LSHGEEWALIKSGKTVAGSAAVQGNADVRFANDPARALAVRLKWRSGGGGRLTGGIF